MSKFRDISGQVAVITGAARGIGFGAAEALAKEGVHVVLADLLGRVLVAPSELPVGILLSLVGGPYFLILLVRRKRHAGI